MLYTLIRYYTQLVYKQLKLWQNIPSLIEICENVNCMDVDQMFN